MESGLASLNKCIAAAFCQLHVTCKNVYYSHQPHETQSARHSWKAVNIWSIIKVVVNGRCNNKV